MTYFISLDGVSLDLPIGGRSLKALFSKPAPTGESSGRIITQDGNQVCQTIKNVSLEINSGEKVGLIGGNGAGKTSLLRVLAGIYAPTKGTYKSEGEISTLFVPTVGMEENASGRENIFLACRTLGFSRAQVASVQDEIIEFAQLGEFIDQPIRLYSAGMRTRLGFAIITSIQPEIVLIDEVFGAGDAAFYKRANQRIKKIIDKAGILVLATHSPAIIESICERVIWVDQGEIAVDGDVTEGLNLYAAASKAG